MNEDIFVVIEHLQGRVMEISYIMLAAARQLAQGSGGQVVALLLGHHPQSLATDLAADRVLITDQPALAHFTPDAYLAILAHRLQESPPRALLLGHTSIGMDIASALSARLALPLVSQCRQFEAAGSQLNFISQLCGGKVMAAGELPQPTALLTVVPGGYKGEEGRSSQPPEILTVAGPATETLRVSLSRYIEPEAGDVDISQAEVLIAVGRGLQNEADLTLAEEAALALGGVVCASRPIVDQGWLPASRLVGKSGRAVKPRLYLALGISGAPEHVESITASDMIIAANTDPDAPIFEVADFGAEIDMLDLLEALVEQVEQVPVV